MPTYQTVEHFICTNRAGEDYIDRATGPAFSRLDAAKAYAKNFGHRHRTVVVVHDGPHTYDPEIYRYEYPGTRSRSRLEKMGDGRG